MLKDESPTAKLSVACETPGILFSLCADTERKSIFGAGTEGIVYRVDPGAEKPTAHKKWKHHDNYVSSLAWLSGVVVSGGFDRRIVWTDAESGEQRRAVENAHEGWVRDLAVLPAENQLVSVGDDMTARIWEADTGKLVRALKGPAAKTPQGYATALYTVAVSPDGKTIAAGDRIGDVCLWDASSGKLTHRLQAKTFYTYDAVKRSRSLGGIRSVCFSPDGEQLAIAGIGVVTNVDGFVGPCRVEVWDWRERKRVYTGQDKHKAVINHVAFHPAADWLVAAGGGDSGGVIAFWDRKSDAAAVKVKPKGHLQRFCLDAEGKRLFAVGHGGFQIWNLAPPASD